MSREIERPEWAREFPVRPYEFVVPGVVAYMGSAVSAVRWKDQTSRKRYQITDADGSYITLDVAQANMIAEMIVSEED